MIRTIVESAFQTGYLSVESEGLLHQMLATKCYQSQDLLALTALYDAVRTGQIKREASSSNMLMELPLQ
ncbi:hypothetical protein H6G93_17405 [Nostoc sp. FACHB-973]|uniref:Uncharacterized protein n=1 Tax=Desmonostoc muscorum LEGE 12446 TaxID=1828758 RepID=A0A8J7DGA6_DESMC|nr:hypothetical protein [Desmonostoc muscorum]MBD2414001.1 hypothetical protein [Nostoc calcicola FACHB-3891]MBD2516761.1 hypothetical protein [Nostoc sp. FACHB-973]MBX9259259.1 hypothetical protein [Desmonostoc muscorum CCALA 125]MDZ8061337.1 hypothetical protein [Nostoc sp. EkiNYC01]OKH35605.1 hypothetical protein FACHB389_12140 [Nostoc calcicola FACHB-389]